MDIRTLQVNITSEIIRNMNLDCINGKHDFIPVGDGSLDVICKRCGIKAMRMVVRK